MPAAQRKTVPSLQDLEKNRNVTKDDSQKTEKETNPPAAPSTNVENAGSVVVKESKNTDNQVGNEDSSVGNPNGVNFETRKNVINRTPAELAGETPAETQRRYGINDHVPDDVHNNPNVTIDRDNRVEQIASGTHLHPDVAKTTYNSSLYRPSEGGTVTKTVTQQVYAEEAPVDDKGRLGHISNLPGDDDGTIFEGVENNFAQESKDNDKAVKTSEERKADEK